MLGFRDKVVIVTGGSAGIGHALAWWLAQHGAQVVLTSRDEGVASEVAGELAQRGRQVEGAGLDVRDAEAFAELAQRVRAERGSLDMLFNNAGIGLAGNVRDMKVEDWRDVVDVNLWGVIHGVHAVYPIMLEQGSGHIVNISSAAGLLPRPGMVAYAASKHAVTGLSVSLCAEAEPLGVKVSVACPGFIETEIFERTQYVGIDAKGLLDDNPIKPMSARDCALEILQGVSEGKAVIPVTTPTHLEWYLSRLSPHWSIKLAGVRARAFSKHRKDED